MDIGKRMKELRIQYGLTQQELADRSELTKDLSPAGTQPEHAVDRNTARYHSVSRNNTGRIFYR